MLKIKSKPDKNGLFTYVTPHLDNIGWLRDGGEFLIVGNDKSVPDDGITAGGAFGITEPVGYKCCKCGGDTFPQRSVKSVFVTGDRTELWCAGCAKKHAFTCVVSSYLVSNDQGLPMAGKHAKLMWNKYAKLKSFICEGDGQRHWIEDQMLMPDGSKWSMSYFKEHGHTCKCGKHLKHKKDCAGDECDRMKSVPQAASPPLIDRQSVSYTNPFVVR